MKFSTFDLVFKTNRMYKPINIDRKNLTLMGIKFSDIKTLENTANAIGTNMFEGFEPTQELVQIYLDWKEGAISDSDLLTKLHKIYGK